MAPGSPCGRVARPLVGLPNLALPSGFALLLPQPPCLQASLFYARNHQFLSCPLQTSNFTETHQCASFSFFQALRGEYDRDRERE